MRTSEEPEAEHQDETDDHETEYELRTIGQTGCGLRRFGEVVLTWVRRTQVVIAYVTVLAGFIVYTVSVAYAILLHNTLLTT